MRCYIILTWTSALLRSVVGVDLQEKRIVKMTTSSHTEIYLTTYLQAIIKGVSHHPWQLSEKAQESQMVSQLPQRTSNTCKCQIRQHFVSFPRFLWEFPGVCTGCLLTIPCLSPTNNMCYVLHLHYAYKIRHCCHKKYYFFTQSSSQVY